MTQVPLERAIPPSFSEVASRGFLGDPDVVTRIVANFCRAFEKALALKEHGELAPEQFVERMTALVRENAAIFAGENPDYRIVAGYHDASLRYKLMADLAPFWRSNRAKWGDDPVCVLFEWLAVMMAEKLKEAAGDDVMFQVKFGPLMKYAVGVLLGSEARAQ